LAWLWATGPDGVRDGKRAVEAATRACELTDWKENEFLDTLAAAYAEVGDFDKAVEYQKKAVSSLTHELVDPSGSKARVALSGGSPPDRNPGGRRPGAPGARGGEGVVAALWGV